jgi:hypothetical protein
VAEQIKQDVKKVSKNNTNVQRLKVNANVANNNVQRLKVNANVANNNVQRSNVNVELKAPKKLRKMTPLVVRIQRMCKNGIDPVTMEKLVELPEDDLKRIIRLGESKKKAYCLKAESAMRLYETAALDGKEAQNPFITDVFTQDEIARILRIMKRKQVNPRMQHTFKLRLIPETFKHIAFWRIVVVVSLKDQEYDAFEIGYAPAELGVKEMKSESLTSGALAIRLVDMFNKGMIVSTDNGIFTITAPNVLRRTKHWWLENGKAKKYIIEKFKEFFTQL